MKSSSSSKDLSKYKLSKNKNYNPFIELNIQKNDVKKNKDDNSKRRKMYKLSTTEAGSMRFMNDKQPQNDKINQRVVNTRI